MEKGLPFAAKLQTPMRQEESGSKKHRSPAGVACGDALTGVVSDEGYTATQMRHQDSVCRQVAPVGSSRIQTKQESGEKPVQSLGQVPGGDKSKHGQEGSQG